MTLFLGLHLHDSFNVVFVFQARTTPPEGIHTSFDTDSFQLSTVEILS